ncbi:MAG: DUF4097 family beta strand repeat protein [Clostridiales bacterium]|nr:DUF4097 family beta strand repeat protein [Clostridiales bacterium]
MKASTKILLISAGIITVSGLIVTFIGAALGGGIKSSVSASENYEEAKYDFTNSVKYLEIKEASHDIEIKLSEDDKAHVICYNSDRYKHDVELNGDTLKISVQTKKFNEPQITWNIGYEINVKTTVFLPQGQYDELLVNASSANLSTDPSLGFNKTTVTLTSGDVIYSSPVSGNASFTTSSGNVSVRDISPSDLTISCTSGDVNCENINASGRITIGTSSGEITLEDIICSDLNLKSTSGDVEGKDITTSKALECEASSGNFKVSSLTCDSIAVERTSGDITIDGLTISSASSLKTSSGEVEVNTLVDVYVDGDSSSGDRDVDSSKTGVDLTINTSSGDVDVTRR